MLPDSVLLIDDEAIVLDVLKVALEKRGLTVRTASRFSEGLKLLKSEPFACLMVDKNLTDGTGIDLIRQARELQPFCGCMVMTGYPNAASILEALRLGAIDYLEKPFPQMNIVQEKVRAAVDRQKLVAERAELAQALQRLQSRDLTATELGMAQSALEVAQADAKQHLNDVTARHARELLEAQQRLETLKGRHLKTVSAAKKAAAQLANVLDSTSLPPEADQELRETRRLLTSVIDDVS